MNPVCVLTGISAGIGKAAALALAQRGVQVVGVVRDPKRGRAAVHEIRDRVPAAEVDLLVADLSSLDEVRELAEQIRTRYDHLDVVLHIAGVAAYRRETTVDGYERTFATNHLAPYLLTRLLLDRLEAADNKPARVISVWSEAHRQVRRIPWDDLQSDRSYSAIGAYNLSKLANVLFVRALAERHDRQAVVANAVSPGFVRTELNRGATLPFQIFFTPGSTATAHPRDWGGHACLGGHLARGRRRHRRLLREASASQDQPTGPGPSRRRADVGRQRRTMRPSPLDAAERPNPPLLAGR
jgi:NAD(P)-dependent dehydrogenase (short-subunit alcohol dehydrogenase family)